MITTAVLSVTPIRSAASEGSASQRSTSPKRSCAKSARRGSAMVTRQSMRLAALTSATASGPAPQMTRWVWRKDRVEHGVLEQQRAVRLGAIGKGRLLVADRRRREPSRPVRTWTPDVAATHRPNRRQGVASERREAPRTGAPPLGSRGPVPTARRPPPSGRSSGASGASPSIAARASRAASSSRHPPLMRPIGRPSPRHQQPGPGPPVRGPVDANHRGQRVGLAPGVERRRRRQDPLQLTHRPGRPSSRPGTRAEGG